MDNIRRPVPVTVPHVVSLSNDEVDRIVMNRLREISHGITVNLGDVKYYGFEYPKAVTEQDVMKLIDVRDAPILHTIYVSYLAFRLEQALRLGPLKTPDKP